MVLELQVGQVQGGRVCFFVMNRNLKIFIACNSNIFRLAFTGGVVGEEALYCQGSYQLCRTIHYRGL